MRGRDERVTVSVHMRREGGEGEARWRGWEKARWKVISEIDDGEVIVKKTTTIHN